MFTNLMLCGRIGKQPESRQFGDKTVWSFSVATSRSRKKPDGSWEDLTDWHNCQYWGNLNQRAGKGALIVCSGSLESYKTDAGETRWSVAVRDIRVLNSASNEPANPVDALSEKFGEVKTVPMPAAAGAAMANNTATSNNSQPKNNDDELPF